MSTKQLYTPQQVLKYFFNNDKKLFNEVNLSKEEIEIFFNFSNEIVYANGLRQISGGFSSITIYDIEEDLDDEGNDVKYLICECKCGVQSDCENSVDTWENKFNRTTKKFED